MRKAIVCMSILMLFGCLSLRAQQSVVRQDIVRPIHALILKGSSNVEIYYDSVTFVEVTCPRPQSECNYFISVEENTLVINDTTGKNRYKLHVVADQIKSVTYIDKVTVSYPNGTLPFAFRDKSQSTTMEQLRDMIKEIVVTIGSSDSDSSKVDSKIDPDDEDKADNSSDDNPAKEKNNKRHYSPGDRSDLDFLWGFNNWGDQWYNGLMKMGGAYELRTSFSSYQLAMNYAVVMTRHWQLKVGIGYESDVYKFANDYVVMDNSNNQFALVDAAGLDAVCGMTGTSLDKWSTRFVARYVTMPISLRFRDIGIVKSWGVSLGVVPGLSFSSGHTGLKHELSQRGKNCQDADPLTTYVNPYKLDVRLTVQGKGIGFFLQVPTLPLFVNTDVKVYPIKIGFML